MSNWEEMTESEKLDWLREELDKLSKRINQLATGAQGVINRLDGRLKKLEQATKTDRKLM
jgi:hypothetical protein